jgi:spoIIIJ-associated protein
MLLSSSRRSGRRRSSDDGEKAPALDTVAETAPEPTNDDQEEDSESTEEQPQRGSTRGSRTARTGERRPRGGRRRRGARERSEASDEEPATPVAVAPPADEPQDSEPDFDESYEPKDYSDERTEERAPVERDAEAEQLVAEVLDYFLATMGVVADTYVRDDTEDDSLVFEIEGEDAGLLIGRRGETLQSLQFLVRMVVSRQLGRKAFVLIDVENYRQRRADMLRRLARRTAGRVASSGRSSALDPMPPGERRIVHMSLAAHPRVMTESEGEGNQRRVVILPRR